MGLRHEFSEPCTNFCFIVSVKKNTQKHIVLMGFRFKTFSCRFGSEHMQNSNFHGKLVQTPIGFERGELKHRVPERGPRSKTMFWNSQNMYFEFVLEFWKKTNFLWMQF